VLLLPADAADLIDVLTLCARIASARSLTVGSGPIPQTAARARIAPIRMALRAEPRGATAPYRLGFDDPARFSAVFATRQSVPCPVHWSGRPWSALLARLNPDEILTWWRSLEAISCITTGRGGIRPRRWVCICTLCGPHLPSQELTGYLSTWPRTRVMLLFAL